MTLDHFRTLCLALPGATEGMPFGEGVLVFKVEGTMFALCGVDDFSSVNLKCDPELAIELRERYDAVQPGYHMSKVHWNTVSTRAGLPLNLLVEWTLNSYNLVRASLPKKVQLTLAPAVQQAEALALVRG